MMSPLFFGIGVGFRLSRISWGPAGHVQNNLFPTRLGSPQQFKMRADGVKRLCAKLATQLPKATSRVRSFFDN
jgi:hypothetical protein